MLHGRDTRDFWRALVIVCVAGVALVGACVSGRAAGLSLPAMQKAPSAAASGPQTAVHSIAVAFNYDFTKNPACDSTMAKGCVAKFEVFDISLPEKPYLLFTIAIPPGAAGKTNPIKASGPRMSFVVGKHRLGVSAVTAEGGISDPAKCSTIVMVGPAA